MIARVMGIVIAGLIFGGHAQAQAPEWPCVYIGGGGCTAVSSSNPLPVTNTAAATGAASYAHIAAGQATTVVKAAAGTLFSICLNSAAIATNTTNVYDNASGAGTIIATPAATTATVPTCLSYGAAGLAFANGLTIITATANGSDMTVSYK